MSSILVVSSQSTYRLNLERPIQNVRHIILENYLIFDSTYIVNVYNNQFIANGIIIALTQGNYTGTQIASDIQSKLNLALGPITFTCSFNASTNKFTINSSSSVIYIFPNGSRKLLGMLSGTGTSIVSTNMAVISSTSLYFVVITNIPKANRQGKPYSWIISNNVTAGSLNSNQNPISMMIDVHGMDLNYLDFEIRDSDYNLCEFNGVEYTLELSICN